YRRARRDGDRRPEEARVFVGHGRRERHRLRGREPGARGLHDLDRTRFDHEPGHRELRRRLGGRLNCFRRRLRLLGVRARAKDGAQGEGDGGAGEPARSLHGIIPHSNILLTMGAETLLKTSARICGSSRSSWTRRCSISGLGLPCPAAFSCHNCSQLDDWYFWTTLLATASRTGCWAIAIPAPNSADPTTQRTRRLVMAFS